ncbi:MAG: hypothetical protein ACR2IV_21740 [Bryobacteraceae bacterium]
MGLDFLRAKAKRFEQQRDKSKLEEFDTSDLLARSKNDRLVPLFRCQLDNLDTVVVLGLVVLGRVLSEKVVTILQRGKKVGCMLPEDAANLTRLLQVNHGHLGVISLTVVQEAGIDGIFVVKAKKAFKQLE